MIDLVGDDRPELFTEKLNLKRPSVGGPNPPHQDYPYWVDTADVAADVATAMVFLDDATVANGCLPALRRAATAAASGPLVPTAMCSSPTRST